jgi:ABC-2 type transport system permease protein
MAILAPGIVVILAFLAAWQAPFSTINRFGLGQEWAALTRFCMRFWAILMLPLYIVLQSALLAGLDHAGGQWRSILARPLPRWTFYATKLTFIIGLAVAGSALLALGIVLDGAILPHLQRDVGAQAEGYLSGSAVFRPERSLLSNDAKRQSGYRHGNPVA